MMSDTTQTSTQAPLQPQHGPQEPASRTTSRTTPQSSPQHPRLLPLPTRIRRAMSGSWTMLVATLILLATVIIGLIPAFNSQALKQDIVLGAVPAGTDGHIWGTDALGRDGGIIGGGIVSAGDAYSVNDKDLFYQDTCVEEF